MNNENKQKSPIIFTYRVTIQETHLDVFGHVNNAAYLVLFEQARWDLLTKTGFGLKKIQESKFGPTLLELKISFLCELYARDQIVIESMMRSYDGKVGALIQTMLRNDEVCCKAEMLVGLFDMTARKLVLPTDEWMRALGLSPLS